MLLWCCFSTSSVPFRRLRSTVGSAEISTVIKHLPFVYFLVCFSCNQVSSPVLIASMSLKAGELHSLRCPQEWNS